MGMICDVPDNRRVEQKYRKNHEREDIQGVRDLAWLSKRTARLLAYELDAARKGQQGRVQHTIRSDFGQKHRHISVSPTLFESVQ